MVANYGRYVGLFGLALVFGVVVLAQAPSWSTKPYHVIVNGNELYSYCESAAANLRIANDNVEARSAAGAGELVYAGECRGYVAGVVDSIPAGEGFEPDADVTMSQHVDIVLAYLRNHPEQRHLPAYFLARTALTEAFPQHGK